MKQKRYQYCSKEGLIWTNWFSTNETPQPWQLKPHLKNEYKDK